MPALHSVFHLGTLHGHTGIGFGISLHLDGVAISVCLGDGGKFHLERWSFIFLHPERLALIGSICTNPEYTRESLLRQLEIHTSLSVGIGHYLLFLYSLTIGVKQTDSQFTIFDSLRGRAIFQSANQYGSMHCLPWAVDRPIGIDIGHIVCRTRSDIVIIHPKTLVGTIFVVIGIGKNIGTFRIILFLVDDDLSLFIAGQLQDKVIFLVGIPIEINLHLGFGNRLTCGSTDHSQSQLVLGLLLGEHKDVTDIEKEVLCHLLAAIAGYLSQIDARGKCGKFQGVFTQLEIFFPKEFLRQSDCGILDNMAFYLLEGLFIVEIV